MSSKVLYKNEEQILVDDFMDVGYMAENIVVLSNCKEKIELQRSNADKSMSMFVSFPSVSDFENEILRLDKFMSDIQVDINCYLFFDSYSATILQIEKKLNIFKVFFDEEEEYGNMYGTKIEEGTLEGRLAKALFLISKDGAVFYVDMPDVIEKSLDIDRLHVELNKAYIAYTGVGCHG